MSASNNNNFGAGPTALSDQGFMAVQVYKDSMYTYIGVAMPGTPETESRWSVKRILTDGSGGEGTTHWANGRTQFENKADDMVNLSYS